MGNGSISILRFCLNLREWFKKEEYVGHDPYLLDGLFGKHRRIFYKRLPFVGLLFHFVKKISIHKALGLIIRGDVSLYRLNQDETLLEDNEKLIDILMQHRWKDFEYPSWGWPFAWSSLDFKFPKDYPIAVVTAEIGHSFLDHYECTKSAELLSICEGIGQHLIRENGYKDFGDRICFYYGDFDKYLIHNTNLYAAAYLARLSKFADVDFDDLILKSVRFTLDCQNEDGSWYYWAPPFVDRNKNIDNRHSGYIIVALKWINEVIDNQEIAAAIDKGFNFYKDNFFSGPLPRGSPHSLYPIDMHDIAQSIITNVEFGRLEFAERTARWAIENMSNGTDRFYYQKYSERNICTITFFRWSQAWMYRALALLHQRTEGR